MQTIRFNVTGMKCDHCARTLTDALNGVNGVMTSDVSLSDHVARVQIDEGICNPKTLADAIRSAGFRAVGFVTEQ